MTPVLIVHIAAGALGILSGATALAARKGGRLHRGAGTLFVLCMLTMATLGAWLAAFGPNPAAGATPPQASITIAALTLYLAATAWMTARRRSAAIGLADYGALLTAAGICAALLVFGLGARQAPAGRPALYAPYFVFAGIAALFAGLDLKVILQGGLAGPARIARHLWRMCFALFFATAFFFIGQQKVMPHAWRGSPVLLALGLAPLALMVFWLVRVRWKNRRALRDGPGTGPAASSAA